jgi:potassium efflux system protein
VFTGTIAGLSLLGLQWSRLQWLAAGFSVGLGFGLQEIFANFISGLMVLFERPIRVGDVITIGTVEGTVTRIRTRATTIVDWDNRVLVRTRLHYRSPGQLTLSDSVTRIVIGRHRLPQRSASRAAACSTLPRRIRWCCEPEPLC